MPQILILVYYVLLNSVMMCLLYRIFMDLSLPLLVLFVSCLRNPFLSQHHKGIPLQLFLAGIYCWVVWGEVRIRLFSRVNPLGAVDWNAHPLLSICNTSVRTYEFPHLPGFKSNPLFGGDHPRGQCPTVLITPASWEILLSGRAHPSFSSLLRVISGILGTYSSMWILEYVCVISYPI